MFDIIMPIYKTPIRLLKKSLESIKNQTCGDYKVWICDGTPHEWNRYADLQDLLAQYPEFTVVKQTGKGVSQARNQIITMGSNPYVAFLDSDDEWMPHYLEMMKSAIEIEQDEKNAIWFCEIISRRREVIGLDTKNIGLDAGDFGFVVNSQIRMQSYDVLNLMPKEHLIYFHISSPIWFSGAVFRRDVLEMTELFDEVLDTSEDTALLLDILSKGYYTVFIPQDGVFRNEHGGQLTKTHSQEIMNKDSQKMISKFKQKNPSLNYDLSEELHFNKRAILKLYNSEGRSRGMNQRNLNNQYEFLSPEEYEIETL